MHLQFRSSVVLQFHSSELGALVQKQLAMISVVLQFYGSDVVHLPSLVLSFCSPENAVKLSSVIQHF